MHDGRRWGHDGREGCDGDRVRAVRDRHDDTAPGAYDALLGGKDNFTVDRELAGQLLSVNPGMEQWARDNRAFVVAAAARAAREGGIAQFLDLGAGLPTRPAVHDAVRKVNPSARVAYVDFDPVAVVHSRALLAKGDGLAAFQADLTDPKAVLADPDLAKVLDLTRPPPDHGLYVRCGAGVKS